MMRCDPPTLNYRKKQGGVYNLSKIPTYKNNLGGAWGGGRGGNRRGLGYKEQKQAGEEGEKKKDEVGMH